MSKAVAHLAKDEALDPAHLAALESRSVVVDVADIPSLEETLSTLPEGAFTSDELRLGSCRIVHKQRLSRQLVFIGLRASDGRMIEGILRRGVTKTDHENMSQAATVGDVVAVTGMVERSKGRFSIHVRVIEVEEAWIDLYGPKCMFRDDALLADEPTREPAGPHGPGLWSPSFTAQHGRLLLLQIVSSHAPRVHEYVTLTQTGVTPLGIVAPISGPHMGRDERGLVVRTHKPNELVNNVLQDGAVCRFIQRWYALDALAPTMAAAAKGLISALTAAAEANTSHVLPLEVRVQCFPRTLEAPLVAALRASGVAEPNPRGTLVACAAYVYGTIAYGVSDTSLEGGDGGSAAVHRGERHARPSKMVERHDGTGQENGNGNKAVAAAAVADAPAGGGQVSRAFYKLREVASRLQLTLNVKHAIDIGASPGGWTTCMIESGCSKVTAVDPGLLYLPDAVIDRCEHMRMRIEEAIPILQGRSGAEAVALDLLVCDMNAPPAEVLAIARTALPLLRVGAPLVLTFKNAFPRRGEWLSALEAGLEELSTFAEGVQVVHLLANTSKETTVVGRVRAGPPVPRRPCYVTAWERARAIAGVAR